MKLRFFGHVVSRILPIAILLMPVGAGVTSVRQGNTPGALSGDFRIWQGRSSGVVGIASYDQGEFILPDQPFDDHGARDPLLQSDTQSLPSDDGTHAASARSGSYAYPEDGPFTENSADIVETRVAADASTMYLLIRLNTLMDASTAAFYVEFDSLRALQIHGTEGLLNGAPVDVTANLMANTFEARFPLSLIGSPQRTTKILIASGLWDAASNAWFNPSPIGRLLPYFDVAYVPGDTEPSYWNDAKQARDIGANQFVDDAFTVDIERMRGACTDSCLDVMPAVGWQTRIFRSDQSLGEGVEPASARCAVLDGATNIYKAPYQPYQVFSPDRDPVAKAPLVILLHPAGGNHMTYQLHAKRGVAAWATQAGAIVVMPLARGEAGSLEEAAQRDILEVLQDVERHYAIDVGRLTVMGAGSGGLGAIGLAVRHPDLIAGVATFGTFLPSRAARGLPTSSEGDCGRSLSDKLGNAINIPFMNVYGEADGRLLSELDTANELSRSMVSFLRVSYPGRRYDPSLVGECVSRLGAWLTGLPRHGGPPVQVTYRWSDQDVLAADRAYWLSGLRVADGAESGLVQATRSAATADRVVVGPSTEVDEVGLAIAQGVNWIEPPAAANYLKLQAEGVSRLTVDAGAVGWQLDAAVHLEGLTDQTLRIELEGSFPQVTVHGARVSRLQDGHLFLDLDRGSFDVVIEPEG